MTIVGTVAATVTSSLVNRAGVTSSTADPSPGNNAVSLTTPVVPTADLALAKTATPTAIAGQTVAYTLTVTNRGPSDAQAVRITDTLPVSVTFKSAGPGCADAGNGTVICTASTLAAGVSASFTITVTSSDAIPSGSSLENDAVVGSQTQDPNPTNNTADADTSILAQADLKVTKRSTPDPVVAGEFVTYTITVENFGPSTATQVQVFDSLPSQIDLISATSTQGLCAGTICFLEDISAHAVVKITLVGQVKPNVRPSTLLLNAALGSSQTPDPGPNPNFDVTANHVTALASLRIDKRDLADPVAPESLLMYAINVTNDGPSDANSVKVTDQLPAGVRYMSDTDSCVESPAGILKCTLGTMAPDSTKSFLVTVQVNSTVVSGTSLVNNVSVASSTPLTNSVLTDAEPTLVQQFFGPPADLKMTKTASSDIVLAGGVITYRLAITNYGPAAATDVKVSDPLPTGLTLISVTPSQGTCDQGITCLLGTLPYNGTPSTAGITIVASVASNVLTGTTIVNQAYVRGAQTDPVESNNLASVPVRATASADLAVTKSGSPNPVNAGEALAYTIAITNYGPSKATGAVVTDTLPANVTVLNSGSCTSQPGNVLVCPVGDLVAGASRSLVILVSVPADAHGTLRNTVVVGSQTPDPTPANNADIEDTSVVGQADLSIRKTASSGSMLAGEFVTYTLTVQNTGPSAATNVQVSDPLPAGTSLVAATPPQSSGPNPLIWNVGTLTPGETRTYQVKVKADSSVTPGALLRNTASITSTTVDPALGNNTSEAVVQVFASADISVTKTAMPNPAIAGEPLTYTVRVHNAGPSLATKVDLKEMLPAGLTLNGLLTSQGYCVSSICQFGAVPVSRTVVITALTTVDSELDAGYAALQHGCGIRARRPIRTTATTTPIFACRS